MSFKVLGRIAAWGLGMLAAAAALTGYLALTERFALDLLPALGLLLVLLGAATAIGMAALRLSDDQLAYVPALPLKDAPPKGIVLVPARPITGPIARPVPVTAPVIIRPRTGRIPPPNGRTGITPALAARR